MGDLAMIVKAYAGLKVRNEKVLQAASSRSKAILDSFRPSDLSDLAWGSAALGQKDTELAQAIEARALEMADQLTLADYTAIIWAMDQAGLPNTKMIEECQKHKLGGDDKIADADINELGEIAWLVSNSQSKEQAISLQQVAMAELESRDADVDLNVMPLRFRRVEEH